MILSFFSYCQFAHHAFFKSNVLFFQLFVVVVVAIAAGTVVVIVAAVAVVVVVVDFIVVVVVVVVVESEFTLRVSPLRLMSMTSLAMSAILYKSSKKILFPNGVDRNCLPYGKRGTMTLAIN